MQYLNSRRNFLALFCKSAAALSVAATFGSTLLSSCKKNTQDSAPQGSNSQEDLLPPNTDTLTDQEKSIRSSLNYTDQSKVMGRFCDNCKLYTLPQNKDLKYGGCKVVPGPIHPKGHCTAWIHLM